MCDKHSFRKTPEPKTGYAAVMEKKKESPQVTIWFTDQDCDICGSPVYTDGNRCWCKEDCSNYNKRNTIGFISDLIRT